MVRQNGTGTAALRALIVDDTPDIRMLLRLALEKIGRFEVVGEAEDGVEAVRLATALHPDVVLLDLAMPIMDGLQATPEIRRGSPETKIVILSGFSKGRMEREAREIGADAYVEKGTPPLEIVELVRDICGRGTEPPDPIPASTSRSGQPVDPAVKSADADGQIDRLQGRIAAALAPANDLESAFREFGNIVSERIAFDRGGFAVAEGDGFRLAAVCGPEDGRIPVGTLVPVDERHFGLLNTGRPFHVADSAEAEGSAGRYFAERGIRSYATVPIVATGRAQALVGFAALRPNAFSTEDLRMLEEAVREAAAPLYVLYVQACKEAIDGELQAAEALRLEWNRVLRHDLRSPLTVINGFANMMDSAWDELSEEKKREFVNAIVRGTNAMTKLLSDMEQVDQIESVGPEAVARQIDLGTLVEQAVGDVVASSGREVSVDIQQGLHQALGDEVSQGRVLSNLLENALKFSCPDKPVEVTVAEADGMIRVSVRDHGVGMTSDDQQKLFQKFSRPTQQPGKKVPGSGLGLFICKSLVEGQGGQIWVESAPGEGSTFTYTLPLAAPTEFRASA